MERPGIFVSACVIDHLFHLVPGGLYNRQAGQPPFQYGYGELKSIVDYRHHMAAYSGVDVYQGDQWPASWKGEILVGNIHQNALNHEHVEPMGASFKAQARPDFMTTDDGWFMPVSTQTGPDGAVWVMDWYDRYPCYQNAQADPDGLDRERGRIWRVVYKGTDGKTKLHPVALPGTLDGLIAEMGSPNLTRRLLAMNDIQDRFGAGSIPALRKTLSGLRGHSSPADATTEAWQHVHTLWLLERLGVLGDSELSYSGRRANALLRVHTQRILAARTTLSPALDRLAVEFRAYISATEEGFPR
jgi:hypothetical protein